MNRFLHIDSRNRVPDSSQSRAVFNLPEPVRGIRSFRVKYVQFTNTLYNVTADSNTLALSSGGGPYVLTPDFYRSAELIAAIGALVPGIVTLDKDGELNWTLPGGTTIDMVNTTLHRQLGLDPAREYAGGGPFTTHLQLAFPMSVCLFSP